MATTTLGAFTGGAWAILGITLALISFLVVWGLDKRIPHLPKVFASFTFLVLAVFALELPLSADLDLSAKMWLRLASVYLPLLLLTSPQVQTRLYSNKFVPLIALSMSLGALLLGLELESGGAFLHMFKKAGSSVTEYNRGIAHLVILAFPIFAGLWNAGGKKSAFVLAALLLFPASLSESHTAKLALILGIFCTCAAFYRPLWVRKAIAATCALILGWPFYAQYFFSNYYSAVEKLHASWQHRVEIWDFLSYRIDERPLFGWGLETTHKLDFKEPHGDLYHIALQNAPHAHNFVVQLWVETGLPGLALGFCFMLLTLRKIGKLHTSLQPFALGGFVAALTVAMFGFDFWTDALWAAFTLCAFTFGMFQKNIESGKNFIRA